MILDERLFNESKTNELISNVADTIDEKNEDLKAEYMDAEDPQEAAVFDKIGKDSVLYEALLLYYGNEEEMKENVRAFYDNTYTNEIF